ncbi:glutamate receptor ionotropic, kainate 2-like [Photinus pyralis]|uniref:glutamate receptor ionotropic, kainate 2-like n=1 Tax=Photinus pyralis TaxID=7054 RepID=UPI0012677D8C|nr:glutamate receptor ionotropic, kainate 2-like [Photinus pyralis]
MLYSASIADLCHLLRSGVAAIFGPQSAHTASHVQSICDTMEIPHLETRWDYRLRRESCLVNLYPHPKTLSKAYVDLVRAWGWKSFTIIYESNEGLVRLQELLKAHGPYEFPITVRQLGEGPDYRPLLKQIKNSAESHIVLDCSTEKIYDVLKQAQQIGMMSDYHSYLITSLDLHGVDLEEFKYGGTNITAFRLVDPEGPQVRKIVRDWTFSAGDMRSKKGDHTILDNNTFVKAETALMYDAVHLFAKALHDLDTSQQIDIKPLSCDAVDTWPHGYSLINYMKIVEMRGLTGVIKFDHQGFRSDFTLDIVELSREGLKKIGTWNASAGVNFTRTYGEAYTQIVEILQNKTFVVTTILVSNYRKRRKTFIETRTDYTVPGHEIIYQEARLLCNGVQHSRQGLMATVLNYTCSMKVLLKVEHFGVSHSMRRAVSTRMVAGMWWFFTLIMISSYTANLAAFLTVERMDSPIESAEDLAKQTKIKYGALKGGSTASFFRESNFTTYERMWSFMETTRPSVFTSTNNEGVERVLKGKGNYAYLMESTTIEYVIERKCELTRIGGLLDSKGYGIAMPPNSPFRTAISGAILKLQEEGTLLMLKTRWWKEKRGGGACNDETTKTSSTANALGLANIGGVFVVLMGGMGIACVIAVCEFVWKSRKVAVEERSSLCAEMASELRFALRCHGSSKPLRIKTKSSGTNTGFEENRLPQLGSYPAYGFVIDKEPLS